MKPTENHMHVSRFPRAPLALAVSLALLNPALTLAQGTPTGERTAAEIQAEIDRLSIELEQQKQALLIANATASSDAAATAAPAAEVQQDTALGKVTVRARNRLEPLQEVPLSISVVTGRELERLQATEIGAITQRAANVSWNLGNQRTSSLSIRGVGRQGQTEAQDPSVGFIVDGVSYGYNALTSSFDFTDIDTVEVTRGPQGTLLGKNASLGVVSVTTRRPSFTPDANFAVTYGDWDTVIARAAGGGPIIADKLAYRVSVTANKGQGDIKNQFNRDITWTNKDRVYGRAQLLWTPTDNFSARLSVDAQPRGGETTNGRTINTPTPTAYSNGAPNTLATDNSMRLARPWFTQLESYTYAGDYLFGGGDGEVNNDNARPLVTGTNGASLTLDWTVGDLTLTSISAYKDYHFQAVNDEGTVFDVYRNAGGFWNDYKQWSQELRGSGTLGDLADYQAGLYYFKVHNVADYRRAWGNDAGAWFATTAQYNRLDRAVNPDGSVSGGRTLLQNSLDRLTMSFNSPAGVQGIQNESIAAFGQLNWHLTDALTVTTGVRFTREDRQTTSTTRIKDNGSAPELNPAVVNNVDLGGFASNATTGALLGGNSAAQLAYADLVALKYFGVAATGTAGGAYGSLTAQQRQQVADAKNIRQSQLGVVFPLASAEGFEETQPAFVVSPSFKISDNYSTYVSWQHGEKAGISQFVNGVSNLVDGEKTDAYEIGLKTVLLNDTLVFNTAVFYSEIENYQQQVRIVDEYTTNLNIQNGVAPSIAYTSATGNVPLVKVKGVEIDGVYAGIPNTQIRFAGTYNDAYYAEFPNLAQPVENGFPGAGPYRDASGETLPGSFKYAFNLGVDWRVPFSQGLEFHTSANAAYQSSFNGDVALSSYAVIPGRTLVDLSLGFGTRSGSFDVSLLLKNALDDDTNVAQSWNSYGPAFPRWWGVVFSGKL
jgi:outer membrane receptor protein involved in Fe transport